MIPSSFLAYMKKQLDLVNAGSINELISKADANSKKLGAWIDITEAPYNASPSKTAAENTAAIQAALDTGKNVFSPRATYYVTNLVMNTPEQNLFFALGAKFVSQGNTGTILKVNGDYSVLSNVYISGGTGGADAGIETVGFSVDLINCTVTGTTVNALKVNGLETTVSFGKYKGGTIAGINVLKPDLYLQNPYVEGNRDGIYSNGVGSITAHHVHSFGNSRHGFYLVGASFSQFTGCYADTNGANGYEVSNTTAGITFTDCWGYKSSNVTAGQSDFAFYGAKNIKMIGCRSNGAGAQAKGSSFKFDAASQVDMIGCFCEENPSGADSNLIRFTNCTGILAKYNRPSDVFQTTGISVGAASSQAVSIRTLVPIPTSTPAILSFEVTALIRNTDNSGASVERFIVLIGVGMSIAQVTTVFPTAPALAITAPTFADGGDGFNNLNFTLGYAGGVAKQVSLHARYLGTGRGFS